MTKQDVRQIHTYAKVLNPVLLLNLGLIALSAALVLCYVLWSNSLAAGDYRITILHSEMVRLADASDALMSSKSAVEDPAALLKFAQANGMVEAKNVAYIFEDGHVALQK